MPVWLLAALFVAAVLAALVVARVVRAWLKYRGSLVVTCPETEKPAGVTVDAGYFALASFGGKHELRLETCSRWPERAGCGQECLGQLAASPEGCLVRNIATEWYRGKKCASCGQPFGEIQWGTAQPALLSADKQSMEWSEIAPERIRETLAASLPLCFACHTANRMVIEHPELVVNRKR
jgi:hypothetical protein